MNLRVSKLPAKGLQLKISWLVNTSTFTEILIEIGVLINK